MNRDQKNCEWCDKEELARRGGEEETYTQTKAVYEDATTILR